MVSTVWMNRHTETSSQVARRLTVVGTPRRRRWSAAEKRRIVEESLAGHRQASATARRHGIAVSLLFKWRRELRGGARTPQDTAPAFVPVTVVPEASLPPPSPASPDGGTGRLEIVPTNGRRVVVGSGTDPAWLARPGGQGGGHLRRTARPSARDNRLAPSAAGLAIKGAGT
jgi:transposase